MLIGFRRLTGVDIALERRTEMIVVCWCPGICVYYYWWGGRAYWRYC
jgi:hypothetical protein